MSAVHCCAHTSHLLFWLSPKCLTLRQTSPTTSIKSATLLCVLSCNLCLNSGDFMKVAHLHSSPRADTMASLALMHSLTRLSATPSTGSTSATLITSGWSLRAPPSTITLTALNSTSADLANMIHCTMHATCASKSTFDEGLPSTLTRCPVTVSHAAGWNSSFRVMPLRR